MANTMISVRLSPSLAAALDRAAERLDCSPSHLVEVLLRGSEAHHKSILEFPLKGPFPEKVNLRMSPEAMHNLRGLTGDTKVRSGEFVYGIAPSYFMRSMLAYFFFSSPEALQTVFPNVAGEQEWARLLEDQEEDIPRRPQSSRETAPGDPRIVLLILLLPLLVLLIIGIVDSFKDRMRRPAPPPSPPRPSSPDGDKRLVAGDADQDSEPSSMEGTRS